MRTIDPDDAKVQEACYVFLRSFFIASPEEVAVTVRSVLLGTIEHLTRCESTGEMPENSGP